MQDLERIWSIRGMGVSSCAFHKRMAHPYGLRPGHENRPCVH
jgi:hypothetical protein